MQRPPKSERSDHKISSFPTKSIKIRSVLTIIAELVMTSETMPMRSPPQEYGLLSRIILEATKRASATIEANKIMHVKLLIVKRLSWIRLSLILNCPNPCGTRLHLSEFSSSSAYGRKSYALDGSSLEDMTTSKSSDWVSQCDSSTPLIRRLFSESDMIEVFIARNHMKMHQDSEHTVRAVNELSLVLEDMWLGDPMTCFESWHIWIGGTKVVA